LTPSSVRAIFIRYSR